MDHRDRLRSTRAFHLTRALTTPSVIAVSASAIRSVNVTVTGRTASISRTFSVLGMRAVGWPFTLVAIMPVISSGCVCRAVSESPLMSR